MVDVVEQGVRHHCLDLLCGHRLKSPKVSRLKSAVVVLEGSGEWQVPEDVLLAPPGILGDGVDYAGAPSRVKDFPGGSSS